MTKVSAWSVTAGSVSRDGITSTSGSTGAGLKKCRPTTRCGCRVPAAMRATEIDDVLVASRHSAETMSSSRSKSARLSSASSRIASMTTPASANPESPVSYEIRPRISSTGSVSKPLRLARSTDAATLACPRASAISSLSTATTSQPARAATSTMPDPMTPQPTTPTSI